MRDARMAIEEDLEIDSEAKRGLFKPDIRSFAIDKKPTIQIAVDGNCNRPPPVIPIAVRQGNKVVEVVINPGQ